MSIYTNLVQVHGVVKINMRQTKNVIKESGREYVTTKITLLQEQNELEIVLFSDKAPEIEVAL